MNRQFERPGTQAGRRFAERHWYRLSPVSILLTPIALCFGIAVILRRALYRYGILKSVRLGVPVIVVGNLTVGGTGKTPLVLWAVERLRAAGKHPGIVLRGYGGHGGRGGAAEQALPGSGDTRRVGDEAMLLAERSECPVWAGRDRVAAAMALLAAHPHCDVIVCDDGLQHYRLARDVEIAVEDDRGHGNGLLLPAGPLREPASRRVDATVVNANVSLQRPGAAPVFQMRLAPCGFQRINGAGETVEARHLAGKRLHAVAGIGNPRRFFELLRSMGLSVTPHAFPDHHDFIGADLEFNDCDAVLMTEKDGVKCRAFGRQDLYTLRVVADPAPALADVILKAFDGCTPA